LQFFSQIFHIDFIYACKKLGKNSVVHSIDFKATVQSAIDNLYIFHPQTSFARSLIRIYVDVAHPTTIQLDIEVRPAMRLTRARRHLDIPVSVHVPLSPAVGTMLDRDHFAFPVFGKVKPRWKVFGAQRAIGASRMEHASPHIES
jgi:hypothetical protein